ncbi:MAG: hypothetical protein K2W33_18280 [Burkholderiales bacterium]|nr:hypothetical protein [Burkholderiales bacterium]
MASAKKSIATKATGAKPMAPVTHAKATEQAVAEGVALYVVIGRILRNGQVLRPANPATSRAADTVELTELEAYGLRGFVELADSADAAEPPTNQE